MQVHEIMREYPYCCSPSQTATQAAQTMRENNVGALPVVARDSGGAVVGMLTDRDLCMHTIAAGKDPNKVTVSECMSREPIKCSPSDDARFAMLLFRENQVRRMPVVDASGAIVGMLSINNLVGNVDDAELVQTLRAVAKPHSHKLVA
jgi:CBS domain-containing protein